MKNRKRNSRAPLSALCLSFLGACASGPEPRGAGPSERRVLTETQALSVIESVLSEAGAAPARAFPVRTNGQPLVADVHLPASKSAIEWVSDDDRLAEARDLPVTRADGPLRIVSARSEIDEVQLLVLDAAAYVYEANPLLVQRGAPGIDEAEERLKRDVSDYLTYLRTQGGI